MSGPRPNILWLMTDEQRCDSLGCYNSRWAHSPTIDRLAADGAVFETAVTPAPLCVPARTSVLAGKPPCRTGVWYNTPDLSRSVPNLMGHFRGAGYRTASFGKQHYAGIGTAFATEDGPTLSPHVRYFGYSEPYDEADFDVVKYPDAGHSWIFGGTFPAPAGETAEAHVVEKAMRWLDAESQDAPFFLRLSFNGPHTPVVPPEPFDRLMEGRSIDLPGEAESLPDDSPAWLSKHLCGYADASGFSQDQVRRMRQCYYGEVAYLDSLFGQLLDGMTQRGLLDNTIVVYVSDHGTHLGDYGLVQKQTFFEPVVNVPFIFWYPSQITGPVRFRTPVETQSLLPTLIELAGIETVGAGCAPSLASSLRSGREPEARPVFSEFTLESSAPHIQHTGRLVMVRDGDWKLSACLNPRVHDLALYNVQDDPLERTNRAEDPACRARRDALLQLIRHHIDEAQEA